MPLTSVLLLGGVLSFTHFGSAGAQDETKPAKSARGGLLATTAKNRFEVFFYPTGLRVFPLDSAGTPIDVSKLTGTATFYHPNSPKPWFTRTLYVESASTEQVQASLVLAIRLSTVPPKGAKVAFEIAGLPDSGESAVVATVPVEFVAATNLAPSAEAAEASPRYVYGPGYYGFGYYQYPGPQSAPAAASAPTVYSYSSSGRGSSSGRSGFTRDWTTGHHLPSGGLISKPWLRPVD